MPLRLSLVFGFPEAARQTERVQKRAVDSHGMELRWLVGVLGNKRPIKLAAASRKQSLESAAHRHLVVDVELTELAQYLVVIFDQLVGGLQVKRLHGGRPSVHRASPLPDCRDVYPDVG
jgi:hypothetical protein